MRLHSSLRSRFDQLYRLNTWMRRRFTASGRFLLGVLLFSGALGVDTRLNLVHQIFALTLVALLVALLWAQRFRGRFQAERRLPKYATVGQSLRYRVAVTALGRRRERGLHLIDELAAAPSVLEPLAHGAGALPAGGNWFDRKVGYQHWVWLMGLRIGALEPEGELPDLSPGVAGEAVLELIPLRRGWLHFSALHLGCPDPLGLFRGHYRIARQERLLVLPRRYPLPAVVLPGRRCYQRGGVSFAAHVGDAEEFIGLRDYRPGDPLRKLHWRAFARTGRPIVREYQEEYLVRHALLLDTFGAPGDTFEAAVSVAASLVARLDQQESLLDLLFVADRLHRLTAGRGVAASTTLLEGLACVTPTPNRSFAQLAALVLHHTAEFSGAVCILLDWDGPRRELVGRLYARGLPLLVLLVSTAHAAAPPDPDPLPVGALRLLNPTQLAQDLQRL